MTLLSLIPRIELLMTYDAYVKNIHLFDVYTAMGTGVPGPLLDLSSLFYSHSLIWVNNSFIYQLSSMETAKLLSCFKELNTKLDIVSYTIEKVLYLPPHQNTRMWYNWEPMYRRSYELQRQTINILNDLIEFLASSGNFDPSILGM